MTGFWPIRRGQRSWKTTPFLKPTGKPLGLSNPRPLPFLPVWGAAVAPGGAGSEGSKPHSEQEQGDARGLAAPDAAVGSGSQLWMAHL